MYEKERKKERMNERKKERKRTSNLEVGLAKQLIDNNG